MIGWYIKMFILSDLLMCRTKINIYLSLNFDSFTIIYTIIHKLLYYGFTLQYMPTQTYFIPFRQDLVNLNMRRKYQHFKTHLESHLSMELLESTLQSLGLGLSLACGRGDLHKCVHELQKITKKSTFDIILHRVKWNKHVRSNVQNKQVFHAIWKHYYRFQISLVNRYLM